MTILLLIGAYVVLAALLYGIGRVVHSYLYTDVPGDLYWRGPAAAGVIWLVSLAWPVAFNAMVGAEKREKPKWPVSFNDMFLSQRVSATTMSFKEFIAPAERERKETRYRKNSQGQFRDPEGRPIPESTPPMTLTGITDADEKVTLNIVKDADGHIDRSTGYFGYADEQGRLIDLRKGQVSEFRWGQFWLNVFGGLIGWAAWFVSLWLLLDLEGGHAFVVSIPCVLIAAFMLNPLA